MKPNTKQTQIDKIKADLLEGDQLDPVLAFERHFITRLAPIIERLRKRGWPIVTERRHKNGLAVYYLPEGWRPDARQGPIKKGALRLDSQCPFISQSQ